MSLTSFARRVPRPRLTYANIASTAALVLALGTGTAYAANTVFSTDIVDGEVMNVDLATNAVNTGKIVNGGVWGQDIKADAITNSLIADSAVGSSEVENESLTNADLATDSVQATEIADNSIDGGEIINDSLGSSDLAPGSVGTSEVADNSLTGADVAAESLTMSDIVGANKNGAVSFSPISTNHCATVSLSISGATAGDAVVVTVKGALPAGVFLYGTQVESSSVVKAVYCNLSGATSPAVTDLPVRVVTYH